MEGDSQRLIIETNSRSLAQSICTSIHAMTECSCGQSSEVFRTERFCLDGMVVVVPFSGSVQGEYVLACDESTARSIYARAVRQDAEEATRDDYRDFWEEMLNAAVGEAILGLERFFSNLTYFPPTVTFGEIHFPPLLSGTIGMRIDKNWSAQATTLINLANPRIVERLTSALTDLQVARKMAETDALTGLYNRSGFVSQLSCAVAHARTHETPLGVLMIDVDKFKEVNDTCGHATGDAVLRAVARAIAGSIAPGDAAFRYGGDEFIVILPDRSSKECCRLGVQIKDEIRRLIRELFTFKEVKATVSIGVTALSPDADENSLLTRVDAALYRAKEQGRDAVVCDCPV